MKKGSIVAGFALILAGCGGGGSSSGVSEEAKLGQGGVMGRGTYGLISDNAQPDPTSRAEANPIFGYDISYYQGVVDYAKLKTAGSFVVIRATFGRNSVDTMFSTNRTKAEAQGMALGFYHYSYPQLNSPASEAKNFADRVGTLKPGQFAVLDFEESYSGDVVLWCKTWLDAVYKRLKVKPLIYLNLSTARGYNWSSVINADYGLWLARWDYNRTAAAPTTPWPFVAMRQYSDRETAPGVSGPVDGNVFYGSLEALLHYGDKWVDPDAPVR